MAFKSASVALLQGGAPGDAAGERAVIIDKQAKKEKKDKKHKKDGKAKKRARDSDAGGGPDDDEGGAETNRKGEEGKEDEYASGHKKSGNTEVLHALPLGFQNPSSACSEANRRQVACAQWSAGYAGPPQE